MKIIRLAIRSILHFRTYSGLNALGLALSLVCVLIIFRYTYSELTVDRFNKKLDRIYVTTIENSSNKGQIGLSGIYNYNNETTFVDLREHPGVDKYSQYFCMNNDEIDVDDRKFNATVLVADSNFLKIMDYPVVSGVHLLSDPKSALITQSFARKIFGDQNPTGKIFRHLSGEILTITGVIGQTSTKSSLSFDLVVSYHLTNDWSRMPQTLILLHPNVDYRTINKRYEDYFESRFWRGQIRFQLFPLSKIYFDRNIGISMFKKGNYNNINMLMTVGFLILLVGIINYVNTFTVVILRRGKEFGVKKVFGAGRYNIFMQLLIENLSITVIALVSALFIAHIADPLITNILQFDRIPSARFDIALSFSLLLFLPVITTLYPFFRYNYRKPVTSLRNINTFKGRGSFRLILLSFQYIITIILIIVSLFFIKQLQFMLNTDPGYRIKDIVKVNFLKPNPDQRIRNAEEWQASQNRENLIADEIVQKMDACPLFTNWTYGQSPNKFSQRGGNPFKFHEDDFKMIKLTGVSESWLRIFEIPLKEGRLWDDTTDDGYRDYFLIVTESVLKLYGITDFNDALLQSERRLWFSSVSGGDMSTNPPYKIVGVVKDFNYLHLSKSPDPTAFSYSRKYSDGSSRYQQLIAAIVPGRTPDAIQFLRKLHDETVGGEFVYSFVEDEVREMYKEDKKVATIYSIFTFIAIFISVLGLFSMSLFDIQQRRKEIAIRKVNGALVSDIIRIILKKYFLTLGISFVIAAPVALLAINRYLEDFANKAPVSWWLFAAALIITAGISLLTLIYQTLKAAGQNPAETVKS